MASGGIFLINDLMDILIQSIHIQRQKSRMESEIYHKALSDETERLLAIEERRIKEIEYLYQIIDRLLQSEDKNLRERAYNTVLEILKREVEP